MKRYVPMLYTFLCFCLFLTSCLTIYAFECTPTSHEINIIDSDEYMELQDQYNILCDEIQDIKEVQKAQEKQIEIIIVGSNTETEVEAESKVEEEKEVAVSNRWNITLTPNEIDLLARIVMLESGAEPQKGQEAVVEVIFNRMYHEVFPNSLEEVLSQSGQFSTWKNRNIKAATPTDKVLASIDNVLSGRTNILPYKTVYFALKAQNSRIQTTIGNHIFCNY